MNKRQDKEKSAIRQLPSQIMDLMLDVVLEIMGAKQGSIMLLDDKYQELTIRSARGLKNEIIQKTHVALGHGISGKVAASGQAVFLRGKSGNPQAGILADDLVKPDVHASCVLPIRFQGRTLGTVSVNFEASGDAPHDCRDREHLVQNVISHFLEYFFRVSSLDSPDENSQVFMRNIFREYGTLREMRVVLDYVFQLVSDILGSDKKGAMILRKQTSDSPDMVLGYGFETREYGEFWEKLLLQHEDAEDGSEESIRILKNEKCLLPPEIFPPDGFIIIVPLTFQGTLRGEILLLTEKEPVFGEDTRRAISLLCNTVAGNIGRDVRGQKLQDFTLTDNLTGTYNYGLWWQRLHEEFSRARRQKESRISLIVFDVDRLTRFNRIHNSFKGDQLLRHVADRIKKCLRPIDIVGRIGGDEFGVALISANKADALMVGKRITKAISGISDEMGVQFPITMSGGMAGFPEDTESPEKLVEMAKTALVSAKIRGGNCIKLFEKLEE